MYYLARKSYLMVLESEVSFSHCFLEVLAWTGHLYKKHKWDIIVVVHIPSCKARSGGIAWLTS